MSQLAFDCVEAGLGFGQQRAAVLAADTANARTPGFVAHDVAPGLSLTPGGARFATILHEVSANGPVGLLEYAMGAQGQNLTRYHALADQERAMLHELRMVAEEARR